MQTVRRALPDCAQPRAGVCNERPISMPKNSAQTEAQPTTYRLLVNTKNPPTKSRRFFSISERPDENAPETPPSRVTGKEKPCSSRAVSSPRLYCSQRPPAAETSQSDSPAGGLQTTCGFGLLLSFVGLYHRLSRTKQERFTDFLRHNQFPRKTGCQNNLPRRQTRRHHQW